MGIEKETRESSDDDLVDSVTDDKIEIEEEEGWVYELKLLWHRTIQSIHSFDYLIPRYNYYWVHYTYFVVLSLLGGCLLFVIERGRLSFVDCLFVMTSFGCVCGLSTIDNTKLSLGGMIISLIWAFLGGLVNTSLAPLVTRLVISHYRLKVSDHPDRQEVMDLQTRRIITFLLATIALYCVLLQGMSALILGLYVTTVPEVSQVVEDANLNGWHFAIHYTVSSFQNAGVTLISNDLATLADKPVISFTLMLMVAAGNTLFPIFLRMIIKVMEFSAHEPRKKEDLKELLRNPRKYYYLLYPFRNTLYLAVFWIVLTATQWAIFFLEWRRPAVYFYNNYSMPTKMMIDLFQTIELRSCGDTNMDISSLASGHLAFILVYMYGATFPQILTIRTSNVGPDAEDVNEASVQAKRFVLRDLMWLYFAIVIITFIEQEENYPSQTVPNPFLRLCFEISSAYGTVGVSTGFPNENYSYSGSFHPVSKLLVIATILAGRNRTLPDSYDYAITARRQEPEMLNVLRDPEARMIMDRLSGRGLDLEERYDRLKEKSKEKMRQTMRLLND